MGFTFLGQTVPRLTLFVGGILCAVGIGFYLGTGTSSITALIPTFVGIPLAALGVLAERVPERRSLFMHIAVSLGLITALGGLMAIPSLISGEVSSATAAQAIMLVLGGVYTYACVQSFIHTRSERVATEQPDA